jgi:phage N-6-adenine-methyltransferase
MKLDVMFSKASDEWSTPQDFFEALDAEAHFELDCAATEDNAKTFKFIGLRDDALTCSWQGYLGLRSPICWLNPPYSKCREFIAKAAEEAKKGCTVVCLVPSRTDTRWWHDHVWDAENNQCRPGVEVRFVKGRLKFGKSGGEPIRTSLRNGPGSAPNNAAPFPSVVIVFRGA